ncbi:cation:proton antiporter domain-containing protein [Edaphocola flava]|uniref:cation:proton antiporter domain-containing protein n=1 Tax=Edaphocola flava TaxID=2499629 RepID=UPI00100C1841|nr:cation:proton antiporter [Edaphocola flava]
MPKLRNLLFYTLTIVLFSVLIYFIINQGHALEQKELNKISGSSDTLGQIWDTTKHNLTHPLATLLLQIITIILAARFFGMLFKKMNQPSVIGEIIAGVMLGPSFLGHYFPGMFEVIFPASSLGNLQFLSQIGLILFMFVIGMELDLNVIKSKAKDAIVISHASIIFPFFLGMLLALFLYNEFAPQGIGFVSFALFAGISMSITAFPVLARIVQERGLSKTRLGTIAITCAAADDITAWCILAAVIAIVKAGSAMSALATIFAALLYVILMLKVVQPLLARIGKKYAHKEALSRPVVAIFFITLLISSYTTEVIGIHALFGAFMAGVIMPSNISFRNVFIEKVEDVSVVILLPLFFVFTGLRTEIGLLNDVPLWGICGLIILVAVVGKFVGSALAARFVGQSWKDSLSIGALMNTRGLMELIVLNIGYDLGVLSKEIFAMLVLMALATTFMTGPALDLINKIWRRSPGEQTEHSNNGRYKVLVSFNHSDTGRALLRLANAFTRKSSGNSVVTCMHLSPSNDINAYNQAEYEKEVFMPIYDASDSLAMKVKTVFKPVQNIEEEIIKTANSGTHDLLLLGTGTSIFDGTLLGRILGVTSQIINPERLYNTLTGKEKLFGQAVLGERMKTLVRSCNIPVGILINREETVSTERILIPFFSISDSFLLIYAQKLIQNNKSVVVIVDILGTIAQNPELKESIRMIEQVAPNHIALYGGQTVTEEQRNHNDMMMISIESLKRAVTTHSTWLSSLPSILVMKP